jgi:hypothetical protein
VLAKAGEFSVCLERPDGSRVRKQYTMMGNAVRPSGDRPCDKTSDQEVASPQDLLARAPAGTAAGKSLVARIKARVKNLFGR